MRARGIRGDWWSSRGREGAQLLGRRWRASCPHEVREGPGILPACMLHPPPAAPPSLPPAAPRALRGVCVWRQLQRVREKNVEAGGVGHPRHAAGCGQRVQHQGEGGGGGASLFPDRLWCDFEVRVPAARRSVGRATARGAERPPPPPPPLMQINVLTSFPGDDFGLIEVAPAGLGAAPKPSPRSLPTRELYLSFFAVGYVLNAAGPAVFTFFGWWRAYLFTPPLHPLCRIPTHVAILFPPTGGPLQFRVSQVISDRPLRRGRELSV